MILLDDILIWLDDIRAEDSELKQRLLKSVAKVKEDDIKNWMDKWQMSCDHFVFKNN